MSHPVPQILDNGNIRWLVTAEAVDKTGLVEGCYTASFGLSDPHEWLVQF